MNAMSRYTVLGGSAAAVVAADQATKWLALQITLPPAAAAIVSIDPVANYGGLGGIAPGSVPLMVAFSLVVIGALLAASSRLTTFRSRPAQVAVTVTVGGAVGNLIDRVRLGYVADFLAVELGPGTATLNLADVALFLGVGTLVVRYMHGARRN